MPPRMSFVVNCCFDETRRPETATLVTVSIISTSDSYWEGRIRRHNAELNSAGH